MDGVTDQAMRQITKKYGKVELLTTEFVNVEGWHHAQPQLQRDLVYDPCELPLVAQIYGVTPEYYVQTARDIVQMGFSGVEINFGCPAKSARQAGSGASMIRTPELAREIFLAVQDAVKSIKPDLPVSVKTRLGYETNIADEWIPFLLRLHPDRLTIHGRTLRQGYTGQADWASIGQMVAYRDEISPETLLFGNGDLQSRADALAHCHHYGLDGALIGRAALGNPWLFCDYTPSLAERARVAVEHCELFEKLNADRPKYSFAPMRKHLAGYIAHFPDVRRWRIPLMQATSSAEVAAILQPLLENEA